MKNTKFALTATALIVFVGASIFGLETQTTEKLAERIQQLEARLSTMTTDNENRTYANQLSGHWLELDCIQSGLTALDHDGDGVEWRLATNASCDRYIYRPSGEVEAETFGRFSVDTSKQPVAIDFEFKRDGKTFRIKGIVKQSFGRATIAVPNGVFDPTTLLAHSRPETFESSDRQGPRVFSLIRENYKKTGVWE